MSDIRQAQQIPIGQRELLVIDDACGQVIACESGELWVTQDGDRRDVILPAGQSWRIDRPGPLVLSAFKPSMATLAHRETGRAACLPRREGAAALLARILRWRFPALASFPATHLR
jgi:hypothetical protein